MEQEGEGVTIELLEKYRGIAANIEALQMQIDALYVPVTSPNGRQNLGSYSSTPGNPTEISVMKILDLQEDLSAELTQQVELLTEITNWMREVGDKDPEVVALIRFHYMVGMSWKQTAKKVYGYNDYYRARKRVFRYFGKEI
jgi:hypothetical protein